MSDQFIRWRVRIREFQRRLVRFFGGLSIRDAEYDFVYRQIVGEGLRILDVGGYASLLPLQLAKRGFHVTVYDCRKYHEQHSNLTVVQGDFLTNQIPDHSFDYVVLISSIEHMGFGGYGDPLYEDADFKAMAQVLRVLKPTGKIILTFPFSDHYSVQVGFERWYDLARIRRLIGGLYIVAQEYYIPNFSILKRIVKWSPASLQQITEVDVIRKYGYQGNACYVLTPQPDSSFLTNVPPESENPIQGSRG